jgi:hypothetical protein
MLETMTTLLLGNPELNFSYIHQKEGNSYVLESRVLKERFKGRPFTDPVVIEWLRKHLKEGLAGIGVHPVRK